MFRQGIAALAPDAQVAWVEKHADDLVQEIARLQGHLTRADETFRLIAEVAGADGTDPDDWRATHAKADVALAAVRDLRDDYDAVIE